jgi:hypothetical protein
VTEVTQVVEIFRNSGVKYLLKQRVDIKRTTGTWLSNTAAKGLYNTNFLAIKLKYFQIYNPG